MARAPPAADERATAGGADPAGPGTVVVLQQGPAPRRARRAAPARAPFPHSPFLTPARGSSGTTRAWRPPEKAEAAARAPARASAPHHARGSRSLSRPSIHRPPPPPLSPRRVGASRTKRSGAEEIPRPPPPPRSGVSLVAASSRSRRGSRRAARAPRVPGPTLAAARTTCGRCPSTAAPRRSVAEWGAAAAQPLARRDGGRPLGVRTRRRRGRRRRRRDLRDGLRGEGDVVDVLSPEDGMYARTRAAGADSLRLPRHDDVHNPTTTRRPRTAVDGPPSRALRGRRRRCRPRRCALHAAVSSHAASRGRGRRRTSCAP